MQVLDKGYVRLVDSMPSVGRPSTNNLTALENAIIRAARTTTGGGLKGYDKDTRLLRYLIDNHHMSPFEMVTFKFEIKAPLIVWGHIDRHRTASQNRESKRYAPASVDEFYIPDVWRQQAEKNMQGSDGHIKAHNSWVLTDAMRKHVPYSYALYEQALAYGVAREQARLFLPYAALYQTGIWQMNFRNIVNFLKQRNDDAAQHETREYAKTIQSIVFEHLPYVCNYFVEKGLLNG